MSRRTRHGKKIVESVREQEDEDRFEKSSEEETREEQSFEDTIGSIADDVDSALNKARGLDLDQDNDLNDAVDILQGLKAALIEMT